LHSSRRIHPQLDETPSLYALVASKPFQQLGRGNHHLLIHLTIFQFFSFHEFYYKDKQVYIKDKSISTQNRQASHHPQTVLTTHLHEQHNQLHPTRCLYSIRQDVQKTHWNEVQDYNTQHNIHTITLWGHVQSFIDPMIQGRTQSQQADPLSPNILP
jgi:hypothetical protein